MVSVATCRVSIATLDYNVPLRKVWWVCVSRLCRAGVGYDSLARFFNSAKARPARRPSLVAVEFELLGVVGAARLECGEPAAEAGELIRRQLGDSFGDLFDFHAAQYSTGGG